jgi:ABC-type polysaccharide/polyol phosphate transport system ATPase subunit
MSDVVIKVSNLSKKYRIGFREKKSDTLMGKMGGLIKSPLNNFRRLRSMSKFNDQDENVHWALRDINFEVKQGEVLGIIGHNGAGKSTLLKILSRITPPSTGEIELIGRVSSLLEVGTGFHQELTGRDNIYMNGTIHGMRKREIDSKLDEIVEFSGIEKYIDTPVKFYSSGMKVRLGFAVAAHLEPEILIIDEVLAVGDAEFQRKCLMKMDDVSKGGRTVLFVSHDMSAISKICPIAMLLNKGQVKSIGQTKDIINDYLHVHSHLEIPNNISDAAIEIKEFDIDIGDEISRVSIKYFIKAPVKDLFIGFVLSDSQGYNFLRTFDFQESESNFREPGDYTSTYSFNTKMLNPGKYSLRFNIMVHRIRWIAKENPVCVFEIPYNTRVNDLNIDGLLYQMGGWEVK